MRGMLASAFLWIVVAILGSAPCPAAEKAGDDLPAHVDFTFQNVRYQVLPNEVRRVFVSPDDRAWLEMRAGRGPYDSAWMRRQIEREFSKPVPQLTGAVPVLFEPGGRIWFLCDGQGVLLGYDGRTWIEREHPSESFFEGGGTWVDGCGDVHDRLRHPVF